ncbi:MAG: amino acid ABC transporter permease [Propionicimonas sp.]|uniref:amino acid ABC transporter permease n=1 Tax=Propionicimonas sp. TaxID=1955623 RepID=UPI002B205966|nr:amino acid ABC transporter permease [Propionicimonas sp.]MEA4943670.1 amino acid ABC transporter permease [Propionicimonas sp.]MEA5052799.1 amino acid ABC transporter permease [Propionicimonas sp.]MEA5118356.1 amino acid ABC transporter permease [Propionicimonas sp.]
MSAETSVLFDVPGPKARARYRVVAVVGGVVLLAILAFIVYRMLDLPEPTTRPRNNQFTAEKWMPFLTSSAWVNYLLPGLLGTLLAAVVSVVLSLLFGVLLGIGRLVRLRWVRWVCGVFVEFFRSVPVLMMMIFAYYAGVYALRITGSISPFFGVVVGLTLYNSCVIAELVRSGVNALPKGQKEAGLAIGLTPMVTLTTILLPQALTAMAPSMLSQLVVILKDSALGYMINYLELMRAGTNLASVFGNLIPTMIVLAVMYIIINSLLTRAATAVRGRLRRAPQVQTVTVTAGMVPEIASEPRVPRTLMPLPEPDEPPTLLHHHEPHHDKERPEPREP